MSAEPAVRLADVVVSYTKGDTVVTPIDHLDLHVERGSLVLLLGPSGCGKTTLLSCMAGILRPTSGTVVVDGVEVTNADDRRLTEYRRHTVGIVFQAFNLIPSLTAVDNVAVVMRATGRRGPEARRAATELLESVGLGDRLHHRPGDLSGGQQQRVAIARALALDPPVILADEPTANLDHVQVEAVLRILRSLTSRGRTVVVSTHDHRLLPLADRVVDLGGGALAPIVDRHRTVELAAGEVLFVEGSSGDLIFEVQSGEIELTRRYTDDDHVSVAIVGAGDCFGEMAPLFELPRSATARAVGPAVVIGRTIDEFRSVHGAELLKQLVGRTASDSVPTV
jgi:putative ABC transport system ATP-binding protein